MGASGCPLKDFENRSRQATRATVAFCRQQLPSDELIRRRSKMSHREFRQGVRRFSAVSSRAKWPALFEHAIVEKDRQRLTLAGEGNHKPGLDSAEVFALQRDRVSNPVGGQLDPFELPITSVGEFLVGP